jgi:hypothetical protein
VWALWLLFNVQGILHERLKADPGLLAFNGLAEGLGKKRLIDFQGASEWPPKPSPSESDDQPDLVVDSADLAATAREVPTSGYKPLVIPDLDGHRQARKGFLGRWPIGLNAQHVEHHHELAHVLTRMPGGPLQIFVQRDVAVVDVGLARKIGRLAWAIPPGPESPLSLSETYALKYWWCSPPRTGIASVRPTVWTARGIGASLCSDRCVRASL